MSAVAAVGRPKRSPVWDYFELQRKSVCQVLKPNSDVSEICGHKIEGKFPTNLIKEGSS